MVIYFEDGKLKDGPLYSSRGEVLKVDAGMGFTKCREKLEYIDNNFPFDVIVYTNSLDAFSNYWSWDEKAKIPQIYLRNENNEWRNIIHFTDRELRRSINLSRLYINGEFQNYRQDKNKIAYSVRDN